MRSDEISSLSLHTEAMEINKSNMLNPECPSVSCIYAAIERALPNSQGKYIGLIINDDQPEDENEASLHFVTAGHCLLLPPHVACVRVDKDSTVESLTFDMLVSLSELHIRLLLGEKTGHVMVLPVGAPGARD